MNNWSKALGILTLLAALVLAPMQSVAALKPYTVRLEVVRTAITDATNASPIVITSAGHGLQTGDRVYITGVGGNTAANGFWNVTLDGGDPDNKFALDGSTGNGAYTSGGYQYPMLRPSRDPNVTCAVLRFYVSSSFAATHIGTDKLNWTMGEGQIYVLGSGGAFTLDSQGKGNTIRLSDYLVGGTSSAPPSGAVVTYWVEE